MLNGPEGEQPEEQNGKCGRLHLVLVKKECGGMGCAEEAKKVCCSSGRERAHKDLKEVLQVASEVVEAKTRPAACPHCVRGPSAEKSGAYVSARSM